VKRFPKAGGSQPKSNHKTNRISPAKGDNKMPVEDLPRTNKSHLRTMNHVDSNSRLKRNKFIGTARFRNDHFGAIMSYGDYVVGESVISKAERPDSPTQAVQVLVSSAGTPLSTTIDQDAPSLHISSSSSALQSHSLPPGVIAEPHFMEDHTVAPVDTNPFVNVFALEPHSEASSSGDISSTESPYISQTLHHLNK
nr:integrase, catalytic region, zinc finger, CCHC-type, peptidase aspartic, catalytic [Tanacetum cinerariifolium]